TFLASPAKKLKVALCILAKASAAAAMAALLRRLSPSVIARSRLSRPPAKLPPTDSRRPSAIHALGIFPSSLLGSIRPTSICMGSAVAKSGAFAFAGGALAPFDWAPPSDGGGERGLAALALARLVAGLGVCSCSAD